MNNWFRWEREASIHLLFPTLEVFYPLLTSYSGVAAPNGITKHDAAVQRFVTSKVRLDSSSKRLLELLKHYSAYKDNRKKEILIYLHYIDSILKEFSIRTGLTVQEVRASLPNELEDILNGKLTKSKLQERINYCVIVWERNKNKPEVLTGKEAKKWEAQTLETRERITSRIVLHFFRHGSKVSAKNMSDHETPLSDLGREQEIRVVYHKEEGENSGFNFDAQLSADILQDIQTL